MKSLVWVVGWAAVWVVLTVAGVMLFWRSFMRACDDCVELAAGGYKGYFGVVWEPLLLSVGLGAGMVVVVAAWAVSRAFRHEPGSLV